METDFLNALASADPNAPTTNGALLLLRAEMKYGFKTNEARFDRIENALELVAQQLSQHMDRSERQFKELRSELGGLRSETHTAIKSIKDELQSTKDELRSELQSTKDELRSEFRSEFLILRSEMKDGFQELKAQISQLSL